MTFLPTTKHEMEQRGWEQVDFVYVCGDAYVDHPSFGAAIITRLLEAQGFKVGVIAQPDWHDEASIAVLGEPRLGFLVSAGNMDSMVNHYTVARKRRSTDAYSPGGQKGLRPDRAVVVYAGLIRRVFKTAPIIIGGIEASLRRLAHYDYWQDRIRRSILLDSGADLLMYGMGERGIIQIAEALDAGLGIADVTYVDGTVYRTFDLGKVYDYELLPSFEEMGADRLAYARSFAVQYRNADFASARRLVEPYEGQGYVVQNPPQPPLATAEMDAVYRLPYERTYHPSYEAAGGVPAIREVQFSLASSRGCFGECAFCALTFHQGRVVQSRSHDALVAEAELLTRLPGFKGYIHDVGGPTANFRQPACGKQFEHGACVGKRCLSPEPCRRLEADHGDYLELLARLRAVKGVKKVFIRSGIRFDYVLADKRHGEEFLDVLCEHHVSGQLKVAPEHVSDEVLRRMGKPPHAVYEEFARRYAQVNERLGKRQYLVPYLMSSHPGCGLREAVELAEFCRDMGYNPEQVQDFYPTPSTLATVMYATGVDPLTMEPVYVARSPHEKALQRALVQYRNPKNHDLVLEALAAVGREDLIGYGPKCLVRPRKAGPDSAAKRGGREGSRDGGTRDKGAGGAGSKRGKGAGGAGGKRGKREGSPGGGKRESGNHGGKHEGVKNGKGTPAGGTKNASTPGRGKRGGTTRTSARA